MNCPDWNDLVTRRDAGDEPAGWSRAVAHMDACDACRRSALAADPTLVFRRLPAAPGAAADVESMRRAVASLREADRLTGGATPPATAGDALAAPWSGSSFGGRSGAADREGAGRRWAQRLRGIAAALLLVAAGFAVWIAGGDETAEVPPGELTASAVHAVPGDAAPPSSVDPFALEPPTADELAARPVFEGLSRPRAADVYQVGDEDLLVVMVVDETLDI